MRARQTSSCGRGVDWGQQRPPQPRRKAPRDDLGAAPPACFWQRREHVRPLRRHATDRGQHRTTHRDPRHTRKGSSMPRPLRKARRVGANALPTRPARTARRGRVAPRRPRRGRRNKARQHEAATNPQRRALPAVGNRRQKDHQRRAARPRAAKIPLANVRPAAKPALARPSPIRQTARKGRLNFLYFGNRPSIDTAGHRSDFAEAVAGEVRRGVDASMPAVAVEDSQDVFRPAHHPLRQVLHVECSQNDACPGFAR